MAQNNTSKHCFSEKLCRKEFLQKHKDVYMYSSLVRESKTFHSGVETGQDGSGVGDEGGVMRRLDVFSSESSQSFTPDIIRQWCTQRMDPRA